MFHSSMKHIAIDYHFVHDQVTKELIQMSHIIMKVQLANILTKPLSSPQFSLLQSKIDVIYGATIL